MAVNPILNSISSILAQQSAPVSVSSPSAASDASEDLAPPPPALDTSPAAPVLQSAALVNASSGFAQLGSLLEVAQSGTQQVGALLDQLQALAQQAVSSDGGTDLGPLDSEFQFLLAGIDQVVGGTTFGGTALLTGTLSGSGDGQSSSLSLPDLSTSALFTTPPSISTPQGAAAALSALAGAQGTVDNTGTSIDNVTSQLSFAEATVNSALANATAASSTLTESDLASGVVSNFFAGFLAKPASTAQAQTGNLTDTILNLLQE